MTEQPTTGGTPGTGREPDEAAAPTPASQVDESLTTGTDPVDPSSPAT